METPVFVYTNYPEAELWVNGISQGRQKKGSSGMERYRLMWNHVEYQPGTLKVVAYNERGEAAASQEIHTAGSPCGLSLEADRTDLVADGKELAFITVSALDEKGYFSPTATDRLQFKVKGAGSFRAVCNGDPTSLESFQLPTMKLFSGKLVVIVQASTKPGIIELEVFGKGYKKESIQIRTNLP
jgi:beta-galactosidase